MDDELDFGEYIRIAKKHWMWALLSFIIVLGAVGAYTYLSNPVYQTKSYILVTSQDQANFLLGSSAPKATDLETQKIIIQSPSVMTPVYIKYGEETFSLTATIIKNSNIIELAVETNNPENAVNIVNDIAENYVNYTTEVRKQDAENNIDFIQEKIIAYNKELNVLDLQSTYYKTYANNLTRQEKLEYQNIQREITAKTKIYDYLLTKKEEAELTSNLKNANLKIIEYAEYPEMPVKPNKQLNLALGVILALGAAMGAAILANSIKPKQKPKKERF